MGDEAGANWHILSYAVGIKMLTVPFCALARLKKNVSRHCTARRSPPGMLAIDRTRIFAGRSIGSPLSNSDVARCYALDVYERYYNVSSFDRI